jgi:hypothetical protein
VLRQAVPDDKQLLVNGSVQRLQELHKVDLLERSVHEPEIETARAERGNHRQLFPVEAVAQHRRASLGRLCSYPCGALTQTTLVDKEEDSALSVVFFNQWPACALPLPNRLFIPLAGTPAGRWQENPIALSSSQTLVLPYAMPNSHSINCPIRRSVHISVAKLI